MRSIIRFLGVLLVGRPVATNAHAMQDDVDQALTIFKRFQSISENAINRSLA